MQGLTKQQVLEHQALYGTNEITIESPFSPLKLFLSQFPTVINGILVLAALFSFFLGNYIDALFIAAILLVNGLFSFFQEYRAQKALEKLKEFSTPIARVVRDNHTQEISVADITVDDIVALETGDKIPADGIITISNHLEIDESLLTGESLPIIKNVSHSVFRGTFVARGRGYMKVTAIGMTTRFGEIAKSLATVATPPTPLQKQIDSLSKILSLGAILLSLLLLPLGILEGHAILPLILIAVSIAIAAIPESLPGVITIALAVGANRLARKNAIVRKMASVETLGATQIILTDKTGTLTQNKMSVKEVFLPNKKNLSHMLEACLRGNTAFVAEGKENEIIGDKTDGALLVWARSKDGKYKEILATARILDEYEFDSKSKTITTVVSRNKQTFVYVRGAPEEVLVRSTLSKTEKEKVKKVIASYAKEGLRVIGFGYKKEPHTTYDRKHAEEHIEFLGLLGLYDPPRKTAKQAIANAKSSGVRIIMVTGDSALTALSIAKEVGLIDGNNAALTGDELVQMNDKQLAVAIKEVTVFARVTPEDKLRIATLLQSMGYIVGVTGDGVNDALALEKADVGVAMGENGSDVAKEAADIVLTNDDIFTLTSAIAEGRKIYDNILKAITYLLAGNLSEILFVVAAVLIDKPLALLPTQILWINLVTDAFPALALASGGGSVRSTKPRNPKAFLLSGQRFFFIVLTSLFLAGINLVLFSQLLHVTSEVIARTITFNVLVIFQLLMAFVINRSIKDKMLLLSVLLTIAAQIIISTVPFFQQIFHLGW